MRFFDITFFSDTANQESTAMIRIRRNSRRYCKLAASFLQIVFSLTASSAFGGNLLLNPGFDTPEPGLTPPNYTTSISGYHQDNISSAEYWGLFNSTAPTTTSQLLPSTDPPGGGYMISIVTDGAINGAYQFVNPVPGASASVDVYVLRGTVTLFIATGPGLPILGSVTSTTLDEWQTLTLTVTSGNPDEIAIYSSEAGSASYHADNAYFSAIPEPSSLTLAITAVLPVIRYWCRKRRRGPTAHR
jgi:hypothetical protein